MTPEELRALQMRMLGNGMAGRAGQMMSPEGTAARLAQQQTLAENGPPPEAPPPPVQTQLGGPQERPPSPGMLARLVALLRMGK